MNKMMARYLKYKDGIPPQRKRLLTTELSFLEKVNRPKISFFFFFFAGKHIKKKEKKMEKRNKDESHEFQSSKF